MKSIEHDVPAVNSDPTIKQSETENLVTFKMESPRRCGPSGLRSHRWATSGAAAISAGVVRRCRRGGVNWESVSIGLAMIGASRFLEKGGKEEQIRASGLSGKPGSQTKLITPMLRRHAAEITNHTVKTATMSRCVKVDYFVCVDTTPLIKPPIKDPLLAFQARLAPISTDARLQNRLLLHHCGSFNVILVYEVSCPPLTEAHG